MREALRAAYRLPPDRRMIEALHEIQRLAGSKSPLPCEASFSSSGWEIRCGESVAGTLPETPEFSHALQLVTEFAKRQKFEGGSGVTPGAVAFPLQESLLFLKALDRALKGRVIQAGQAAKAAEALALISLQTPDNLQLLSILHSRALACLAVSQARGASPEPRVESLVAYTMGYSAHAGGIASSLPASDPWRLYLELSDSALGKLAQGPGASREARLLWLRRQALREGFEVWDQGRRKLFPGDKDVAVLSTALLGTMPVQPETSTSSWNLAEEIEAAAIPAGTSAGKGDQGATPEARIEAACRSESGLLWDEAACKAHRRAILYAAPFAMFSARERPPVLATIHPTLAKGFPLYSAAMEGGRGPQLDYLRASPELASLPAPLLTLLIRRFMADTPVESPARGEAVRVFAARLDSRNSNRRELAAQMCFSLLDLHAADLLYKKILPSLSNDSAGSRAEAAAHLGDWKTIRSLIESDPGPDQASLIVWFWLDTHSPRRPEIEELFETLADRYPNNWGLASVLVDYFREGRQYEKAAALLEKWISRNQKGTMGWYHSHIRQCGNLYRSGHFSEGLALVSPPGDVFERRCASRCLNGLGRKSEAEDMARQTVEENGGDRETLQSFVELLWENGKHDEAARFLAKAPRPLHGYQWQEVAKGFVEVFRERPIESARSAMAAMKAQHVPVTALHTFPYIARKAGLPRLAFDLAGVVVPPAVSSDDVIVEMYGDLKAASGQQAALQWIRSTVPVERRNPLSVKALVSRNLELLWDFIEDPSSDHPDWVWLVRASALTLDPQGQASHRDEIASYFSRPSGDYYYAIGRYLAGRSTEDELWSIATTPAIRCAIAFYKGIKAQGEGNYEEANEWFRVAIETADLHEAGRHLSIRVLHRWTQTSSGLEGVKAARL